MWDAKGQFAHSPGCLYIRWLLAGFLSHFNVLGVSTVLYSPQVLENGVPDV